MDEITITSEHRYFIKGKEYNGVTSVIALEGGSPGLEWVGEWYLQRGSMVHLATALYDMGTLDESSVDERIKGYLESWKRYRDHYKIEYSPENIEVKLADHVYRYAGTLDRLPLADIKCGVYKKADLAQMGAYYGLCQANRVQPELFMGADSRMVVYLDENGGEPCVDQYTIRDVSAAKDSFLCALNWNRFKNSK